MTLKEIVQKRYEQEIKSLSLQARMIISGHFSDFSRLMAFHDHGPYSFNSFTSSDDVMEELFDFSNKLFAIYVKEQINEWKNIAIQDLSSSSIIAEKILDNFLNRTYHLILKTETTFVQKTIKNNCPHYTQALFFIRREKSVNDFLRCSESERQELVLFFDKFGEIYNDVVSLYKHKKNEVGNENELPKPTEKSVALPNQFDTKITKTNTVNNQKTQKKKKKRKKRKNKQDRLSDEYKERLLDDLKEEIKDDKNKSKKQIVVILENDSFNYSKSPSFYDTPHFFFDELTMMASINYGCNGMASFGLSSNYISPSIPYIYNFERDIVKYDPNEIFRRPIVSDRISRSAHGYKWFGVNGVDYMISLKKYGIVAKCINLFFGDYICYVPVEIDDYDGDCLAEIETSDDDIVSTLSKRQDLMAFLEYKDISLRDFKLLEITDKLFYLCDYYDIYDFLGLDEELYEKNDVILKLQAYMSKKTIDEYLWDSYTLDEKNDFLMQRVKTLRNREAYLRFNIVRVNYLPYSKEMELSYLIHSEYSIDVYVNIDIFYNDGSCNIYPHIKVESYDDQFIFFQGKTRIRCEKDYIQIQMIKLTCSDE